MEFSSTWRYLSTHESEPVDTWTGRDKEVV